MTPLKDIDIETLQACPETDALVAKYCLGLDPKIESWSQGRHIIYIQPENYPQYLQKYTRDWNAMKEVVEWIGTKLKKVHFGRIEFSGLMCGMAIRRESLMGPSISVFSYEADSLTDLPLAVCKAALRLAQEIEG